MEYIIYFILVFSSIFQDFFLINYIGEFGRSITAIIVIPIFIIYTVILRRKIVVNKNLKLLIILTTYLGLINIIYLSKYLIIDVGNINILDENISVQTIKGFLYFFNITIFMLLVYNLQRRITKKQIFKPFVFTFYFLFIILIIELFSMPNAWPLLHNRFPYYRVRLTTSESSWTSSIIIIYFVMSYYYYKYIVQNKIMKKCCILIFTIFLLTSTSKGLMINLLLSMFIIIIIDGNLKMKITSTCLLCIILPLIIPVIDESIMRDITNYTSIVTRLYSIFVGVIYTLLNPFGTGNALYLLKYPKMLEKNIYIFNNIDFKFNLSEIYSFINSSTSQNISAKSAFIQYGLYWGIIGTAIIGMFLIKIYKNLFKNNKQFIIIKFAYINIILLLITTISFDIKYELWIFFSIIIYLSENNLKLKINKE